MNLDYEECEQINSDDRTVVAAGCFVIAFIGFCCSCWAVTSILDMFY